MEYYYVYGRTWYGEHVYRYALTYEQAARLAVDMVESHNYYEVCLYPQK